MRLLRTGLIVPLLPCLALTAAAQGVLLHEDFESGASGWTFIGICHVESDSTLCGAQTAPYPSPGHCAWFGSQNGPGVCDYEATPDPGGSGMWTSLALPATTGTIALRYRRFLATEGCVVVPSFPPSPFPDQYDIAEARVGNNLGILPATSGSDCGTEPGWSDRRLDITPFAGTTVTVSFTFETGDQFYNDTLGWWVDDVEVVIEPGVVSCVAALACPCPDQSFPPFVFNAYYHVNENSGGCRNAGNKEARLFGNGTASVSADTVELVAHDLPPQSTAIYAQAALQTGAPFGDGLRCLGGPTVRLRQHQVTGGQDACPRPGEPSISSLGSIPPAGGSRAYQVVYRNVASFCTSATFNTSNGYVIAWQP